MGPHWFLPLIMIPTVTSPATASSAPPVNYRLPASLLPPHYDLELQPEIYGPDPTAFTFKGKVSITIVMQEPTSTITLHSLFLDERTIKQSVRLVPLHGADKAAVTEVTFDLQRQFLRLALSRELLVGESFRLFMKFSGLLMNMGVGLYYSSYRAEDGSTVYLASTKFEATYARLAFPCFDEPAFKSTFNVTLVRRSKHNGRSYRSWSNNELLRTEDRGNGYFADHFRTTPVMPTYLLAFVVADFRCLTNVTKHNVKYSTCARPSGYANGRFMQDWGLKQLEWLEDTFVPPYPMSKIDNMAIPEFLKDGMENWGLVTYQEKTLYEDGVTTTQTMEWTVKLVAHEMSHQWFGNLVSPQWWSYLWLNEGLATFWGLYLVDILQPKWRMMDRFVVINMHDVMSSDSLLTSHSVTTDVNTPIEIQSFFDSITYMKGAALVRMMKFIMGYDAFIGGLKIYLNERQYSAAINTHLFDAMTKSLRRQGSASIDMARVMKPWVTQENYPVVHVRWSRRGRITLTQERFLLSSSSGAQRARKFTYKWDIPITMATSTSPNYNVGRGDILWFNKSEPQYTVSSSSIPAPPTSRDVTRWLLLNVKQYGYYRVNYPEANWRALIRQLKTDHSVIHPINRAQIINDAWALVKSGHLSMNIALQTLHILRKDNDYIPWTAAVGELRNLELMLRHTNINRTFQSYVCSLVHHSYTVMGIQNKAGDPPIQIFHREQIVRLACQYGMVKCRQQTSRQFISWKRSRGKYRLDVDIRRTILCNGVRYGGKADWDYVYTQYLDSAPGPYRTEMLWALACSTNPNLLQKLMDLTLNSSIINKQDVSGVLLTVSDNPVGRKLAFTFLKQHFRQLSLSMAISTFYVMVEALTKYLNTERDLKELEQFMRQHNDTVVVASFRKAVEQTTVNIQWMNDHYNETARFLSRSGSLRGCR